MKKYAIVDVNDNMVFETFDTYEEAIKYDLVANLIERFCFSTNDVENSIEDYIIVEYTPIAKATMPPIKAVWDMNFW